jgi:hypothetical protein
MTRTLVFSGMGLHGNRCCVDEHLCLILFPQSAGHGAEAIFLKLSLDLVTFPLPQETQLKGLVKALQWFLVYLKSEIWNKAGLALYGFTLPFGPQSLPSLCTSASACTVLFLVPSKSFWSVQLSLFSIWLNLYSSLSLCTMPLHGMWIILFSSPIQL